MIRLHRVDGLSMLPIYLHDDYVFSSSILAIHINDVVIVKHIKYGCIVKRVKKINYPQGIFVAGDNIKSTAPETIGLIPISNIIGKVFWHIRKSSYTKHNNN